MVERTEEKEKEVKPSPNEKEHEATSNRPWHCVGATPWVSLEKDPAGRAHWEHRPPLVSEGETGRRLGTNRSTPSGGESSVEPWAGNPNRAPPFWTAKAITSRSVPGEERGYDGTTNIPGRTRKLLVETQGLLLSVNVRVADLGDREGGTVLLTPLVGHRPRLPGICAKRGSNGTLCEPWVKEPHGIRREMLAHP